MREQMLKGGMVPKLVNLLKTPSFRPKTLRLLYHLSSDDRWVSYPFSLCHIRCMIKLFCMWMCVDALHYVVCVWVFFKPQPSQSTWTFLSICLFCNWTYMLVFCFYPTTNRCKSMITYTEGIPILMGLVINFPQVNYFSVLCSVVEYSLLF